MTPIKQSRPNRQGRLLALGVRCARKSPWLIPLPPQHRQKGEYLVGY